jgi:surfeit locus 1 family protein
MSRSWKGLAVIAVVVAAVCVRLGMWQLDRLAERRAANAEALAARAAPEVMLAPGALGPELAGRRVSVAGEFDRSGEVVIRGQAWDGGPGVRVVTPLRIEGSDTVVLVDRGFVKSPDAVHADLTGLDEPGRRTVRGLAFPLGRREDGGQPLERDGAATWRGLDRDALRARLPFPVAAVWVLETADPALPPWPRRMEPPALDDGPHLSYAIQWFSFALIGVVGAAVVAFQAKRPV